MLFSDQSGICYINKKFSAKNFAELVSKFQLKVSDFHENQKDGLQFLLDNKILVEKNEILRFSNPTQINIFREIYLFGSTSYIHANKNEKLVLDDMIEKGLVVSENTLFTKQEADYFNFLLNNRVFDNSLAIRNKYQHKTPYYKNPEDYEQDKARALMILLNYAIKIDDELTFREKQKIREKFN